MPLNGHRLSPSGLLRFLGFFIRNSLTGGLQVATMALRGRSALRPALLEGPVRLPPGGVRVLLVNVMSLMPGTLSVDETDGMLRIHVLDERLPIVAEVRGLEAAIERMLGGPA
jgi:multicomponent Na+:H+ antiporter subunit E